MGKEVDRMEFRGGFSSRELSSLEKDTFASYLQHSMNSPALEFIKYLLGDEYLKFIDVMSGTTLKIPSSKSLEHDLQLVKIYLFTKRQGFSDTSVKEAAKAFGKSALTIRRYTLKVCKVLGTEDTLDGDALNNYIANIKSVEQLDSYYQTKIETKIENLRDKKKANSANKSEDINLEYFMNFFAYVLSEYDLIYDFKYEEYYRVHSLSNTKPFADCSVNIQGWDLKFYYLNKDIRDRAITELDGTYQASSIDDNIIRVQNIDTLDKFNNILSYNLERSGYVEQGNSNRR